MSDRIIAVVLTFNRRDRVPGVLEHLARQTRRPDHVLVVDNGSTDGTFEHVVDDPAFGTSPTTILRLARNGGSAEGYHVALEWCLDHGYDWAWLVEDDLVPEPDALERLLDRPESSDERTSALVSAIDAPDGGRLLVPRGTLRRRYAGTPCVPIPDGDYARASVAVTYFGFLGSLLRLDHVRAVGLPRRDLLGWVDDVEFSSRLAAHGPAYLVPASRVLHDDGMPAADFGSTVRDRLRRATQEPAFSGMWKHAYGFRNLILWARGRKLARLDHVVVWWFVLTTRALLFAPDHRWLRAKVYSRMALDGWHGVVRSAPPHEWAGIASSDGSVSTYLDEHSMTFDTDSTDMIAEQRESHPVPRT